MWRLRWKDIQLCFGKIRWMAAFVAKMAQHRVPRHPGDPKAQVHLNRCDLDSRHQNRHDIHPKRHLFHPWTMRQVTHPISKVCHPDMCIYIPLFPVVNFSILIHMPRITSMIKIFIQICRLMKEHPLVSMLAASWQCSWHPVCRRQQPIERTWQ